MSIRRSVRPSVGRSVHLAFFLIALLTVSFQKGIYGPMERASKWFSETWENMLLKKINDHSVQCFETNIYGRYETANIMLS